MWPLQQAFQNLGRKREKNYARDGVPLSRRLKFASVMSQTPAQSFAMMMIADILCNLSCKDTC